MSRETGEFVARARVDSSAISADPLPLGSSALLVQTRDGTLHAFEAR